MTTFIVDKDGKQANARGLTVPDGSDEKQNKFAREYEMGTTHQFHGKSKKKPH